MNKSESLVSVAMCTYNGEKYLKEQLDSIINQTYKNIEIIITDDCSSDNTTDIIIAYMQKFNIRYYINEENLGFKKNFEKAISLCNGQFIALADQDDIWKNDKIEVLIKEIKDNQLVYSDAIILSEPKKEKESFLIQPKKNLIKGSIPEAFIFNNCVSGNTLLFKQELVKHILPIPNDILFHDSWIAFVASLYGTITYTQESYTYYRRYATQITATRKSNYSNPLNRLKTKEKLKKENIDNIIKSLNVFMKIEQLPAQTKDIIQEVILHYQNFDTSFFNYKLYKLLQQNKDTIFAILPHKKRGKNAFNTAKKLWFCRITLFS